MIRKCILAGFLLFVNGVILSQNYRYVNTVFPSSTATTNVIYGSAPFLNSPYYNESLTTTSNLVMDIYRPTGDAFTNRPAIIFVHGGGFVTGNRNHNDMVAFCDSFARKGYVTATIDYRQGVYTYTDAEMHYTRAVYRGTQDGRTAVRFLRANAATYGIDPTRIYLAGSSAGGFIALHDIYMDDPGEKPPYAGATTYGTFPPITAPDLGLYDIGNNLTYNGEPDAILSLWGAVASPDLITADDTQPVFLVHGTADLIVPFDIGHPFQIPAFPLVYGSNQVNNKLNTLGLTGNMTYFVEGQGHEFYGVTNGMWNNGTGGNAYWDTIVRKTTEFFHGVHKPHAAFSFTVTGLTVNFTDQTPGAASWQWTFGDATTGTTQNPIHNFPAYGVYHVCLYVQNSIASWDTLTQTVFLTTLPANRTVSNTIIHNNESSCYAATQAVTVSNVTVESGGDLTLIAGQSIHLNPGFLVNAGGNLLASITTTYSYCPGDVPLKGNPSGTPPSRRSPGESLGMQVYPNPTAGLFTLEVTGQDVPPEMQVTIFGIYGETVLQQSLAGKGCRQLSLGAVPSGVYLVRLRTPGETLYRRVIKL
ncbi:MAG TPA: carboxylesterase family protein [Bacteroidales bacterium]|nr:carboxylesterase family protein [Bacteroidales bacterium]